MGTEDYTIKVRLVPSDDFLYALSDLQKRVSNMFREELRERQIGEEKLLTRVVRERRKEDEKYYETIRERLRKLGLEEFRRILPFPKIFEPILEREEKGKPKLGARLEVAKPEAKPLVFVEALSKALLPIVAFIGIGIYILKSMMGALNSILDRFRKWSPVFDAIMKMISVIVQLFMMPFLNIFAFILLPIIKDILNLAKEFYDFMKPYVDTIRQKAEELWEKFKEAIGPIIEPLKQIVGWTLDVAMNSLKGAMDSVGDLLGEIKRVMDGPLGDTLKDILSNIAKVAAWTIVTTLDAILAQIRMLVGAITFIRSYLENFLRTIGLLPSKEEKEEIPVPSQVVTVVKTPEGGEMGYVLPKEKRVSVAETVGGIMGTLAGIVAAPYMAIPRIMEWFGNLFKKKQFGGYETRGGPAYLHPGEIVLSPWESRRLITSLSEKERVHPIFLPEQDILSKLEIGRLTTVLSDLSEGIMLRERGGMLPRAEMGTTTQHITVNAPITIENVSLENLTAVREEISKGIAEALRRRVPYYG